MKLLFYKAEGGNFGDDLNDWLWDDLLPGWRGWDDAVTLVGVGTLLNEERLGPLRDRRLLIVGSGVGYGAQEIGLPLPDTWDIRAVRGPQSARALGLPPERGIIDPAVMVSELDAFRAIPTAGPPIFVPHHASLGRHDWAAACAAAGLDYVSPAGEAHAVIARIAAAPLVLAESMHGAIIADAFRVPWVPLRVNHRFNAAKWRDWAGSLDLAFDIPPLFPTLDAAFAMLPKRRGLRVQRRLRVLAERPAVVRALRRAVQRPGLLSDAALYARRKDALRAVLDAVRADYG